MLRSLPELPTETSDFALALMGAHLLVGLWNASRMTRNGTPFWKAVSVGLTLGPWSLGLKPLLLQSSPRGLKRLISWLWPPLLLLATIFLWKIYSTPLGPDLLLLGPAPPWDDVPRQYVPYPDPSAFLAAWLGLQIMAFVAHSKDGSETPI